MTTEKEALRLTDHPIAAGRKAGKRGGTVFNSPAIRKRVANQIWQNRYIYMMVIPVLVYLALFKYMPMYYLRASFYDYKLLKGFDGSKYVGIKWFERLLTSPELWQYIRNTLTLNTLSLLICFPAPLVFALLLNEVRNIHYKKLVQTVSYMPHFISTVVLVSIINNICSPSMGTLAKLYRVMGKTPINFLTNPDYFYGVNIVSGIWQTLGWNAVIYISAISGIDTTLYEAARIDGAGRFQQVMNEVPADAKIVIIRMRRVSFMDQSGLYAMETAIKDLQARGVEVLMTMIQPQPLYMLRTLDVIPALVPERHTFRSFKACTRYLKKTLPGEPS